MSSPPTRREMSAVVRDDNPYSRLVALQRMKVVDNYEAIRDKSVVIIGVGGVGAVVAEMLTRIGVGKLTLVDLDTVVPANLNRMFYTQEHVGMFKVDAAKSSLRNINPDVEIDTANWSITLPEKFTALLDLLRPADLVLCCVDNYGARLVLNQACLELRKPWLESGVAETAMQGHVQVMLPGVTPCYSCAPPLVVASGAPEPKRDGVCAASLPSTNAIIAGFMTNLVLKILLNFGTVATYLGYNALSDFAPSTSDLRPNPECTNEVCCRLQKEHAEKVKTLFAGDEEAAHPLYRKPKEQTQKQQRNTANAFGIEVVTTESSNNSRNNAAVGAVDGLERLPYRQQDGVEAPRGVRDEEFVQSGEAEKSSVDELMAKLRGLK